MKHRNVWTVFDQELTPEERRQKWLSYYNDEYSHWFNGSASAHIIDKRAIELAEKDGWLQSFDKYFREANSDGESPILLAVMFASFVATVWLLMALL